MRSRNFYLTYAVSCLLILTPAGAYASNNNPLKTEVDVTIDYSGWYNKSSRAAGSQLQKNIKLKLYSSGFAIGFSRSYIDTHTTNGSVSTWGDTVVSLEKGKEFLSGKLFLKTYATFNIPNGKATLSGSEKNAVVDSWLVTTSQYGEGFNASVGASIARLFPEQLFSIFLYGSVTKKGEYDPNSDLVNDVIDPSDTVKTGIKFLKRWDQTKFTVDIYRQRYDVTKREGVDYYLPGDVRGFNVSLKYFGRSGESVSVSYAERAQDAYKYYDSINNILIKEQFNSVGKYNQFSVSSMFPVNNRAAVGGYIQSMKLGANAYPNTSIYYDAGRTKLTIGINGFYKISSKWSLAAQLSKSKIDIESSGDEIELVNGDIMVTRKF